mmetsp:Transcript_16800/g.25253  ORF Transcript_16800/g.25253 Transcript_16800/m.25253 type:complete len:193 (-) Transcript_16800:56-634(-)|eukprot:CAMPEP_0185031682 /NCGR_PEP_ID=MMETSP1103-20130426/19288_1 /TAXON_ID=36769 /ORGANISM="Paraphysomonas bandaiensis, Strain Caron Lab Isolate" /LENGTH=192 /DNA_ID=CAMNT_0027567283 /DNA_START=25 /DNA_END=603 /DNA_ORIENTATION=-
MSVESEEESEYESQSGSDDDVNSSDESGDDGDSSDGDISGDSEDGDDDEGSVEGSDSSHNSDIDSDDDEDLSDDSASDTSEVRMQKLIANELKDAKREWLNLHKWVREIREKYSMSTADFLVFCNLPEDNLYFKQLVCRRGCNRNPSRSRGTSGLLLRHAIENTKYRYESKRLTPHQYVTLASMKYSVGDNM